MKLISHGLAIAAATLMTSSFEIRKEAPKGAPVWKAVREAKKNGGLAENIIKQDIMKLLAENLDEARERLNIKPATQYHRVHQMMQDNGIDPYAVIGAVTEAQAA